MLSLLLGVCFAFATFVGGGAAFTSPTQPLFTQHQKINLGRQRVIISASSERKPWEVLRFISQSSKFIKPPPLPLPFIGGGDGTKRIVERGEVLWVPGGSNNFFTFAPLDDVVMGGASASAVDNYSGIWRGTVTDANNGGFVGIRSMPFKKGISALDMSNCKGIELRIRKGGGKRFKFVVRDSTEFNGICWTTEFDAAAKNGNKGTTIRIPFDKQIPTMFAKTMDEKRFNEENAVGFQLAYSKFAYDNKLNENFDLGEFVLQILELKSY